MKIIFIVNNKNNRLAKVLPGMEDYCRNLDIGDVQFISTKRTKHAIELSRDAVEKGCDFLIAVGGDGTLNEVVNGVMLSGISSDEHPVLGLLPYGSANDFARTLGISNSIEELMGLIESNSFQKIDLGKISLQKTGEIRYFINIAGIGLGPEVAKNLEQSSSILGPAFNYFKHIILGFLNYTKKEVTCTSSTWQWKGKLLQMSIANGCYHGNAICVAPDAKLSDGQLQVTLFGDLSIWDYLKNLSKLKKGVKMDLQEVSYHQTKELLIESEDSCGVEVDGEYLGVVPATISVSPGVVNFLGVGN